MASRSWNHIELMGNLTRDPELRFTPNGAAVCTFGMATNRSYMVDGERREDVDFHRLVAWNKLGELCNQLLKKGTRVFIAGRLQYREWETQDGQKRREAEIVVEDMIMVGAKVGTTEDYFADESAEAKANNEKTSAKITESNQSPASAANDNVVPAAASAPSVPPTTQPKEDVAADDLPF